MIDSLYLDKENFKSYKSFHEDDQLTNFSKINIFIGSNNSGKSRFCRTFFLGNQIKFTTKEVNLKKINTIISEFKSEVEDLTKFHFGEQDFVRIRELFQKPFKLIKYIDASFSFDTAIFSFVKFIRNINLGNRDAPSGYDGNTVKYNFIEKADKYEQLFNNEIESIDKNSIFLRSRYIPTLRGLRKVGERPDEYKWRTTKDYFNRDTEQVSDRIYTGLDLYERIKRLLLGDKRERELVKAFESFLSKNFFENKEVNIIPRIDTDALHILIDKEERPIYDLGDGIQSIIILTYPLFLNLNEQREQHFFIEEPEHYLHPGYQRIFLETLLDTRFKNYQYFITTHSNHFLDITLDVEQVSVYTFKKTGSHQNDPTFVIENVENENHNTLELLGVRNASVFLSNCTVWVEGITDRVYLRKYLDIFQKKHSKRFVEDVHYSFVEYGGNNITHWSFLKSEDSNHPNINIERLCGKLF